MSFSSRAAREYFGSSAAVEIRGLPSLKAVFEALDSGEAKHAVVPLENSSSGSMNQVYDQLLKSSNLHIVGEIGVKEDYCLLAAPGADLDRVACVVGHPNILEACSGFLDNLGAARMPALNSSSACRELARIDANSAEGKFSAAVAPREAADKCGLQLLKSGIADDRNITTRYIVLGQQRERLVELESSAWRTGRATANPCYKTSVVLSLSNQRGSIHNVISQFALRGLNIIKVETRPASTAGCAVFSTSPRHWDYLFFIDFEPSTDPDTNRALMNALAEFSMWMREFGTYTANVSKVEVESASWVSLTSIIGH